MPQETIVFFRELIEIQIAPHHGYIGAKRRFMDSDILHDDCSSCAALCCFVFALDKSDMFALDKPAGVGCPNLSPDRKCKIHDDLEDKGFKGCVAFTCHGAGQRVTQELFDGKSWQDDPALTQPMIDSFRDVRRIHEQLILLREAQKLPLTEEQRETCADLAEKLAANGKLTRARLNAIVASNVESRVSAFLRSLQDIAARARFSA